MRFVAAEYWDILGTFEPGSFTARLVALDGRRVATGRDFDRDGELPSDGLARLDEATARGLAERLDGARFAVRSVEREAVHAPARPAVHDLDAAAGGEPQAALRAQTTMRVAQRLYENGLHHLHAHRLDHAVRVGARRRARPGAELYGADSVPDKPRRYERARSRTRRRRTRRSARPATASARRRGARRARRDEHALYELIWKRTLASQMADARGQTVSLRSARRRARARTRSSAPPARDHVPGLPRRVRGGPRRRGATRTRSAACRPRRRGRRSTATSLEPQGHATIPPPRYTEATLVRALEERGIGRPSTYAAIMGTILDRGYVFKQGTALVPDVPRVLGRQLLERHFDRLVDYDFTARMEDDLDRIAAGDEERVRWLGASTSATATASDGLNELVTDHLDEIDARASTRSRPGPRTSWCASGATGRTSSAASERASLPATSPPTSSPREGDEDCSRSRPGERELGVASGDRREIVAKTAATART